jgi:DNA repair protein RAD5
MPRCHICRETISSDRIYQVHRIPQADGEENVTLRRYRGRGQSAKVRALLSQLKQVHHDDIMVGKSTSSTKTVIFSQFTSFLDLIERELVHEGFTLLRFDGTLNQRQRSDVLNRFTNDEQYSILLISLKAGGVGLNLVCANRAYLMDPWWSYAVEAQAIDRIHRMGQLSEVQVTRFIVEGTVEERMLKIQERKKFLASTLGMSEEEKRAQRMEDIKSLFEE